MKKRQGQKGFTLIELMIVVAVIGVLSAIAIPKYQDFAKKGAVASGIATLSALKTNVEDHMATNSTFPTTSGAIGIVNSSIGNVSLDETKKSLTIAFTDGAVSGSSASITRQDSGAWDCKYTGTSIDKDLSIPGCTYIQ